jgi:hypothetical protein
VLIRGKPKRENVCHGRTVTDQIGYRMNADSLAVMSRNRAHLDNEMEVSMLCLGRKQGEQIRIGEAVVTVLEVRGKIVRIGIEAPREIPISRPDKPKSKLKQ